MAFAVSINADFTEDHKTLFDKLENSVKETKGALTEDQIKDISSIVEKISGFKGYDLVEDDEAEKAFSEPIFKAEKLHISAAVSEYLESKENLRSKLEIIFDDTKGMEFYQEKFDKNIGKPCEELNRIWSPTLDAYYEIQRSEELFKQIMKYDKNDYEMLLNAGFCHIVMRDPKSEVMNGFIFFACTVMNPGSCMI